MHRIMTRCACGLLTLVMLAACGVAAPPTAETSNPPLASPSASSAPHASTAPKIGAHDTILTIRTQGGMCVNGACWSEKYINADGSFTATDGTGAQTHGTLDAAKVAELAQQIAATDFAQLKAQPFTGTCPIAYDGQEYIYTFSTLSGPQTIASCAVAIDENSPLFQHIAGLIAVINQE
jgi:hypothetical protein